MKITLLTFLTLLTSSLTTAYELDVIFDDGVKARVTGDHGSPCQDFPKSVHSKPAVRMEFDAGMYTREFYVWSKIDCTGTLIKHGLKGSHDLKTPSGVGSFRII